MRQLFAPLRRRSIWIAFAIVAVLGFVAVVLRVVASGNPGRIASEILLSIGIAFLIAGFVAYITNQNVDYRSQVLRDVERPRRRQIRRAVMRGQTSLLPEAERGLASDFADAYVASTPSTLSSTLLILPGFLFQSAAQLLRWDGDWSNWLLLAEFVLIVVVMTVAIPLQLRWFRNAEELFAEAVLP